MGLVEVQQTQQHISKLEKSICLRVHNVFKYVLCYFYSSGDARLIYRLLRLSVALMITETDAHLVF